MTDFPAAGGAEKEVVTPPGRFSPVFVREGEVLAGNFVIESMIGQGGMAVVYRALQKSLNRPVAVKVLHSRFSRDPEFLARFDAEAGALANLQHPNIVNIIDRGHDGDRYFFAMEYVEGETLDQLIIQNKLKGDDWRRVISACREGLDYVHRRGVVHRDIKPSNILMGELIKISDFGIAHILTGDMQGQTKSQAVRSLGTANYMAPEQIENPSSVDHRADIYSLGVTFYKMFARTLPVGDFPMPSEANTDVPVNVDEVILKAMAKDPAQRYQTVAQFCDDLSKALKVQSTSIAAVMSYRKGPVKGGALYTGADFRSPAAPAQPVPDKTPKPKADEKSRGKQEPETESFSKTGMLRRLTPLPVEDRASTPKPAKMDTPPIKPAAQRALEEPVKKAEVKAAPPAPHQSAKLIAIVATLVALALLAIIIFALMSGAGKKSSTGLTEGTSITEERERILEELVRDKLPEVTLPEETPVSPAIETPVLPERESLTPQLLPETISGTTPDPSPFAREATDGNASETNEMRPR